MDHQPLISMIIPVYNTGKYLESCLDSVCRQSCRDLEILLVDDGSTDKSPALCDSYAVKDPRIRVFHQENRGLSMARNKGLQYASGEYICYVDSDDLLHPDYAETMIGAIRKTGAEAAKCGMETFPDEAEPFLGGKDQPSLITVSGYGFLENMLDNIWSCNCNGMIYHHSVIEGLTFEKDRLCEDVMYNCQAADRISQMVFVESELYGYRENPDSLMRQKLSRKSIDMIYVEDQRIRYLQENHPELALKARIHLEETALRFLYKTDLSAQENAAAYLRSETIRYMKKHALSWKEIARTKCGYFTKASLIGAKLSPQGTVWLNHLRKGTRKQEETV